jgi:hypothetical protein
VSPADRDNEIRRLRGQTRLVLGLFIVALVLSGLTAFPLLWELRTLCAALSLPPDASAANCTGLSHWLLLVREGLTDTYTHYPFIAYGTDWLAFGHLIIALFFIPPWREPGRHVETIRIGLVACVLVIPLALICGPIRGIPFYWRLIDCSFGVIGILPLWIALRLSQRLNALSAS